jgi:hypothetical protein
MPAATKDNPYVNNNCLAYFKFTTDGITPIANKATSTLQNFCKNSKYSPLNAILNNSPDYQSSFTADFKIGSGQTLGLITSD